MRPSALHAYVDNEQRRLRRLRVINVSAPAISGTAAPGNTLTCSDGEWDYRVDAELAITKQWTKDGVDITDETGDTYDVVGGDSGSDIACVVTATQDKGLTVYRAASETAEAVTIS